LANFNYNVPFVGRRDNEFSSQSFREQDEKHHGKDQRHLCVFTKLLSFRVFGLGPLTRTKVRHRLVLKQLMWINVRKQSFSGDSQQYSQHDERMPTEIN
jgi:hypothetical protein